MDHDKVTWETIAVIVLAVAAILILAWILSLTPPTV